jgi:glycyl-tRNA synthetase beta chain
MCGSHGQERVGGLTDFLLELRSEEIPARMQVKAKDDLARLFAEEIAKAGLKAEGVETFATPRRLALIARGLPDQTESVSEERKGPRANAPEQALAGFLRSTGLTRDQLTEREGVLFAVIDKPGRPTGDVLSEAIPAIIRAFPWPKSMRWGDASSSTESLRWVRPLQGIVALFGEDIVECEVDGIVSGAATMGHRFHHSGPITIGSASDYAEKLRACHVIVHLSERKKLIEEGAAKAAAAAGLTVIADDGLVIENAGLTEWPVPLLGRFGPSFLDVPREVIQLTMRTNQKYFACADADGKLANAFICTANLSPSDGGAAVIAGNEKVLSARLSDAKFFWEQDLKVPLEEQAAKLSQIVFHEKLGTVADKVERVAKLARWLVEEGIIKSSPSSLGEGDRPQDGGGASTLDAASLSTSFAGPPPPSLRLGEDLADMAETAARLCKADLVTGMVGEFPELQGVMGGYYARAQGYPEAVADAIRDHYKPVGQGDDVPTAPVTVAVSLADKLDSVFSFASVELAPTGSRDPYAIRRAALGVVSIIVTMGLRLSLKQAMFEIYRAFRVQLVQGLSAEEQSLLPLLSALDADEIAASNLKAEIESIVEYNRESDLQLRLKLSNTAVTTYVRAVRLRAYWDKWAQRCVFFLADRLKVQQREAGVRHDLIDAVFALGGEDDLVRLLARVKALQSFVMTDEGRNLLAGYKRAANILKSSPFGGGGGEADGGGAAGQSPSDARRAPPPPVGEDLSLLAALDAAEPRAAAAIEAEDFEAAMSALASLRAPIDAFFEGVMVNDPDPAIRAFRLGLLTRFRKAVHEVADFSKIEG